MRFSNISRIIVGSASTFIAVFQFSNAWSATYDYQDLFDFSSPELTEPSGPLLSPELDARLSEALNEAQEAFQNSEFEKAEELVRSVTDEAPDAPEGWHLLGMVLANLERYDESLEALDRAGQLYALNAEPMIIKGELLMALGRREEAREAYVAAALRDPSNWRGVEPAAVLAEQDGDIEAAIAFYEMALNAIPTDRLFTRLRLARLYLNDDQADEAVAVLRVHTVRNQEDVRALAALGHAQLAAEMPDDAALTFARAAGLAPDSPVLLLFLGKAQRAGGRGDDAVATFIRAHETFPNVADTHLELANHFGALRDYENAIGIYEAATDQFPEDLRFQRGARLANYRLDRIDAALALGQRLTESEGATPGDFFWLGVIEEKAGNPGAAAKAYEMVVAEEPQNWIAANNLAALITMDDPDRAIELASTAFEASGGRSEVRDTLAWAHFNAGDLDTARAIYDELASAEGASATHLYRHGRVIIEQGDKNAGLAQVEAALKLDPEFRYADEARDILSE